MKSRSKGSFKWFVLLPVVAIVVSYAWMKRLITRPKPDTELRKDDNRHQSQVRRQLRGLPPDHDQSATRT